MFKLFTLEQATELLPFVDRTMSDIQTAVSDALRLRKAFEEAPQGSVEARNLAEEVNFLARAVADSKAQLDSLGIFVKDLEKGTVDFPSQVGAEIVYLCWERGEDAITHYHRLNESKSARHPLPQPILNAVEA